MHRIGFRLGDEDEPTEPLPSVEDLLYAPAAAAHSRTVRAPAPSPGAANVITGVVLGPDEDVRWEWAVLADGRRFVAGYRIVPKWRRPVRRGAPAPERRAARRRRRG